MKKNVVITGYGTVAREFIRLIMEKKNEIKEKFDLELIVTSIVGTLGKVEEEIGIDLEKLFKLKKGSEGLQEYCKLKKINIKENKSIKGDILVECTPTNIETGGPALKYIYEAMEENMDLALASKGALVKEYKEIYTIAKNKNLNLKFSGATAAALPTLDLGLEGLKGAKINSIRGILNGTSNFILSMMMEENMGYDEAIKLAISKGIAEKNCKLDVSGMDTACKILLISNRILGKEFNIDNISIQGIENITVNHIKKSMDRNSAIKLIGRCDINGHNGEISLKVSPEYIDKNDQFYMVNYNNKAISFCTEEAGEIFCSGGASNPRAAAYSVLKDIINMYS